MPSLDRPNLLYVCGHNVPCDAQEGMGLFFDMPADEAPKDYKRFTPRQVEDDMRSLAQPLALQRARTGLLLAQAQLLHPFRSTYQSHQVNEILAAAQFYQGLVAILEGKR